MARYGRADWKSRKIYAVSDTVSNEAWNKIFHKPESGSCSGVYKYNNGKVEQVYAGHRIADMDAIAIRQGRLNSRPFLYYKTRV